MVVLILRAQILMAIICLLANNVAHATAYTFPGNASAPQTLINGDTLAVNSGVFQTPANNSTNYTVNTLQNATINISSGATMSYAGSDSSGGTLFSNRSNSATQTININGGTISAGTSAYAVNLNNSNSSNTDNIAINLYSGAAINGNLTFTGLQNTNIYIAGNATINGTINIPLPIPSSGRYAQFNVGFDSSSVNYDNSSFTTQGTMLCHSINVGNQSTFTANNTITGAYLALFNGSTVYINHAITYPIINGSDTSTLIVAADINMLLEEQVINSQLIIPNFVATQKVNVVQ